MARKSEKKDREPVPAGFAEKRRRFLVDHFGEAKGETIFAREKEVDFDLEKTWPNPWALGRE